MDAGGPFRNIVVNVTEGITTVDDVRERVHQETGIPVQDIRFNHVNFGKTSWRLVGGLLGGQQAVDLVIISNGNQKVDDIQKLGELLKTELENRQYSPVHLFHTSAQLNSFLQKQSTATKIFVIVGGASIPVFLQHTTADYTLHLSEDDHVCGDYTAILDELKAQLPAPQTPSTPFATPPKPEPKDPLEPKENKSTGDSDDGDDDNDDGHQNRQKVKSSTLADATVATSTTRASTTANTAADTTTTTTTETSTTKQFLRDLPKEDVLALFGDIECALNVLAMRKWNSAECLYGGDTVGALLYGLPGSGKVS